MATTGETSTPRKLTELRVVDLKSELEKRGLEKTGIKAALTERLKKAVEEEGNDPEEYLFELGITVAKKNVTPKEDVEETEEPEAETNDTEAPTNEDTAMDTAEVAPESTSDETENKSDEEKKPEEEPENTDGDDTLVEAPKPEEEKVEEALDDGISISIEDEEKLLAEEEEVSEKKANETNESEAKGDKEGDSKPAVQATADKDGDTAGKDSQDMSEEPPEPDSVPPVAPFTTEDIIKLDTSSERKADEDISMIVHIDESQDDLDADLETPKKQPPGSLTDEKSGDAASGTEKEAEAVKCENKQADAKSEKKDETVSGTAADSETKTEKPATTTDKKDNKKDETNSDAKKETSVGDSKDKKESAEKKDVKSKSAAKPDAKKAAVANSRNLWVSGLSSSTRATDLKALFSKHGKVAGAKVVTNARSPGSRCYGFVTMSTAEEASKCIQHLHRTELHGRMISVERAKNDPSPVKPPTKKPSESTPSKAPVKKEVVKKDAPAKTDKDKKDGEKVAEKRPGGSSHTRTRTSSTGDKRPTATRGTAQRPANDKTASRSQSRDKSNAKPGTPAAPTAAKKGAEGQDVLSFDKIKEERERERLRQKERQLREEERRRMRDLERQRERQRDVERRQREEAMRLEREKERLRLEKSRLEREKLEAEREKIALERERQKRERERLEREREEERRRDEQMRVDEQRRAAKRTFDSRGGTGGRDGSFDSWNAPSKRPSMSDNRSGFDNNSRNNFGGRRVVERYNPRDEHGNDQDRPRDRNYEERNRRGSGRDEGRGDRGRNTSDNRYDRNFEDRNNREGGGRDTRPDRGDTNQRVRDDRPRISPHGGRTNPRDPARREGGRTDWKQENRTQPPHRDSTRDTRNQNPDRNYSERGPGSRDNGWQGNNNVVDDRGKSRTSYQPNTGPGILGGFPAGDWDARPQAQSSQVRPGDRQWTATTQLSGGLRTQGGMVSNQPMMTHTPGTTGQFMAAAANIMAGVGMGATRDKVPRYDAYSQIQGNVRRY